MGAASSKAAGRSYKAVHEASKASKLIEQRLTGSVAVDAARASQRAERSALTFEEEERIESKDQAFGNLLEQLGGAIQGKAVDIAPSQAQRSQQHIAVQEDSSGRLPSEALQELLQLQAQAAGGPLRADHLLTKFKADPQLVQQALSRVCLPDIVEGEGPGGIKAFAEWPLWFTRRS